MFGYWQRPKKYILGKKLFCFSRYPHKVSTFYLEKQKSFVKEIFSRPLSTSKQKCFVYWPNFQWRFKLSLPTPLGLERIFAINRWFKKCSSAVSWKIDAPFTSFKMATLIVSKMVSQVGSKKCFFLCQVILCKRIQ